MKRLSKSAALLAGASPVALSPSPGAEPGIAAEAYTIREFCESHRISRASFYGLLKIGMAPETMQLVRGGRRLISREAAQRWRARMEQVTREAERARVAPAPA